MKLIIQDLNKTYPNGVCAMQRINLTISAGMFGLLGPNGAGKSSLMRTIATLQNPDSGSIWLDDIDVIRFPSKLRKVLGYLPQEFGVYRGVTATNLLNYLALLKGLSNRKNRHLMIEQVLELTNLYDDRNKFVHTFSGGMKRRFGIAQLLLNNPKLIIVDEPTAGLDPEERRRFLNVLRGISKQNIVLFSTHLVEDVKALCAHLAIMAKGSIHVHGETNQLVQKLDGKIWEINTEPRDLDALKSELVVLSSRYDHQDQMITRVYAETQPLNGYRSKPNLEDVYFKTIAQVQNDPIRA